MSYAELSSWKAFFDDMAIIRRRVLRGYTETEIIEELQWRISTKGRLAGL